MRVHDFYFDEEVSQGTMDDVFGFVAEAISGALTNADLVGIQFGLSVIPSVPAADLNVNVVGPGGGVDKNGEPLYTGTALEAVDCSVDEYGAATAVTVAANDRYVSVFMRHTVVLSVPKIDGNGLTVYTHRDDGYEFVVRQGAMAATGTAAPPALLTDGVLLADVLLSFGTTQITAGLIEVTRREDWLRFNGTTLPAFAHGTSHDAIIAVLTMLDTWAATMPYIPTAMWFNAALPAGALPPVLDVQAALNAIVYDLAFAKLAAAGAGGTGADHIGVHGFDSLNHYVQWGMAVTVSAQVALEAIGTAIDGHIAGGAPAHPASAVTTAAIAGTPESEVGVSDVQTVLANIFGHLNARTERSTVETVDERWIWQNTGGTPVNRMKQSANQQFQNAPFMKTQLGGGISAACDMAAVSAGLYMTGYYPSEPWASGIDLGTGMNICDLCMFQDQTTKVRYVGYLVDKGGAGTYPTNASNSFIFMDQYNVAASVIVNLNTVVDGLPAPVVRWRPMSCCSDGHYVYVLFEDYNGAASTHYVQAYDMVAGIKHAGWPVGGLALTGFGQSTSPVSQRIKVIELDTALGGGATKLAVLNSWVDGAVAGTSQCVSIIDATDGTLLGEGCGDMPVSGGDVIRTQEALASDGTYVYFGYYNWTTGAGGIATLTIGAPATGKPTGTWPFATMPAACPVDLLFDGNQLWSTCNDAPAVPIAACILHCINFESDSRISQALDAATTVLAIGHLSFDGLNIWVQAIRDMDGAGTSDLAVMFKLPVVQARPLNAWTPPDAEDRRTVVYLQPGVEIASVNMDHMGRTLFDGDGVHAVLNSHAVGDGMEGKIRCVTMAHKR